MNIVPMSVEFIDSMGSDLSVVNAARVSFHKESDWEESPGYHGYEDAVKKLSDKDAKLINYLAKHGHWTPFAHAFLSFRIKAPIFVARQLVKHQVGLAWNEVSRRYVDEEPEFFVPTVWRGRPTEGAKQGSSGEIVWQDVGWLTEYLHYSLDLYNGMLQDGIAPEQARMVLPQNTMTEWIWSGSLAAFARVCKLRLDPHAQQETREVAEQIQALVPDTFKHSWKALLG
jgi:thymidylate synthase (FAD)